MDAEGNYSFEVLQRLLGEAGFDLTHMDHPSTRDRLRKRPFASRGVFGYICGNGFHWWSYGTVDGDWYRFESFEQRAIRIDEAEFLKHVEKHGNTMLVVRLAGV